MTTNYLGSALSNQVVEFSLAAQGAKPKEIAAAKKHLRRLRGTRDYETAIYREAPDGEEVEILVTVEYLISGAEPDVGIMSGYVEVQGITLTNDDGSEWPELHWSDADQADFDERAAIDLLDDAAEYDGPDTLEEARGER